MRLALACGVLLAVGACSPPSPQPQPNEMETVDATRTDPVIASAGNGAAGENTSNAQSADSTVSP